jgi:signal transduction histidine kinase
LIVEAHGGSLTYQGDENGATFRLKFPLETS